MVPLLPLKATDQVEVGPRKPPQVAATIFLYHNFA